MHADIVVTSTPPAGPQGPVDGAPPQPARRPAALVLAVVLTLAVVVTLVLTLLAGGDEDVATEPEPAPAGAQPTGPAALGLVVEAPETVVAGEAARFVVRWTDGSGLFSGGSEDWGDGVATSSRAQAGCEPGAPAPEPAAGSYAARHTWTEPGSYTVVIGVATYVCQDGSAVEEDAAQTLTVEVRPGR
jgi:hypothetical protein